MNQSLEQPSWQSMNLPVRSMEPLPILTGVTRSKVCALEAVSYTHLDVYKRQAYEAMAGIRIVWGDLTNYQDVLNGVMGADYVLPVGGMAVSYTHLPFNPYPAIAEREQSM